MITLDLEDFMFELKEGTLKHVGASTNNATAKLYDIEAVDVREFGDERVKLAFEDDGDNTVEVALSPEQATQVASTVRALEDESPLFD